MKADPKLFRESNDIQDIVRSEETGTTVGTNKMTIKEGTNTFETAEATKRPKRSNDLESGAVR